MSCVTVYLNIVILINIELKYFERYETLFDYIITFKVTNIIEFRCYS